VSAQFTADRTHGRCAFSDGGILAYESWGERHVGCPVLLIRPLGGSMALWGSFRERLAETFRVVSFDLRGTGISSPDRRWVTTRTIARDALGILDHLGIARAHVFGISLGGMSATWLAALAPRRVERLCIASAPARGLALTHASLRKDLGLLACFTAPRADVEAKLVDRILSAAFRRAHPAEIAHIEAIVRAAPASRRSLAAHALAGLLHDARGVLDRIDAPTLVLAGADDRLLGSAPSRDLAAGIDRADFEIIADAGHDVTLEQPLASAARVATHFSRKDLHE
jgi:pimeloyl-ACP methyl ester carboxylesterase